MSVSGNLGRMALVGVVLLLAGCGRRGPLQLPPSAAVSSGPQAPAPEQGTLGEPEHSPLEGERTAELPNARPAKKDFFLDWLLK